MSSDSSSACTCIGPALQRDQGEGWEVMAVKDAVHLQVEVPASQTDLLPLDEGVVGGVSPLYQVGGISGFGLQGPGQWYLKVSIKRFDRLIHHLPSVSMVAQLYHSLEQTILGLTNAIQVTC